MGSSVFSGKEKPKIVISYLYTAFALSPKDSLEMNEFSSDRSCYLITKKLDVKGRLRERTMQPSKVMLTRLRNCISASVSVKTNTC